MGGVEGAASGAPPDVASIVEALQRQPSAALYLELPSRESDPDFYEEIKTPISLAEIQQKAVSGSYSSIDEFKEDFDLMLQNARDVDDAESQRCRSGLQLKQHLDKLLGSPGSAEVASAGAQSASAELNEDGSGAAINVAAGEEALEDAGTVDDADNGSVNKRKVDQADFDDEAEEADDDDENGGPKRRKQRVDLAINALHKTGGIAALNAERQECSLHWFRKLMGYKDKEYTDVHAK